MTVRELSDLLLSLTAEERDLEVLMEGCDCYQDPNGVKIIELGKIKRSVLITNKDGDFNDN